MTVYEVIIGMNLKNLPLPQKEKIGQLVLEEWNKTHETKPDKVQTIETHGNFKVNDYPLHFKWTMERIIDDFICNGIEKPTDPSPPKISSEPRKRNRIKTQQPAFSGKPLLNKK